MAQEANVNIVVGSKADTRGFKQAETALSKLNRSVKNVAATLGVAYGARAVANFGKASVKAFAADDKAAQTLTRSLKNLGLAFADIQVKDFITSMEQTFGVVDDQLRPAFQRLLTTTGSVAKSQDILKQALDLSAASGIDVVTVAGDLAKAYTGQTRGLTKYGLGLSQTQLKAMKFEEVQKRINDLFGGQAALRVSTYSGKIDLLTVAADRAKESIGKGLVDAISAIGGGNDTQGLQNVISFIDKLSGAVAKFETNFGVGIGQALALFRGDLKTFKTLGESAKNGNKSPYMGAIPSINAELAKKAEWDRIKAYKKQNDLINKNTKATKEQTALQKANGLFELDQIQLVAALKGKLSEEDRKRAELQLAILQGNTTEASKLAGEVATAQGLTEKLVAYYSGLPDASNPFSAWLETLKAADQLAKDIANYKAPNISVQGQAAAPSMATTGTNVLQDIYNASVMSGMTAGAIGDTLRYSAMGQAAMGNPIVNVTVQGSVTTQQDLVSAVRDGLLNNSLSGKISTLERSLGTFGG